MSEQHRSENDHVIRPRPLEIGVSATELVERTLIGAGAGLIADGARHFTDLILAYPGAYVGLSIDALITPGGLGISAILPLLKGGYIDWLAISGANLYFDAISALGKPLYRVPPACDSADAICDNCGGNVYLRRSDRKAVDAILKEIFSGPDFQQMCSTAEVNRLLGHELRTHEKEIGVRYPCLLSTAYELGIPIYNPAPVGGPLGSLISSLAFMGNRLSVDPNQDLNESAALLNDIQRKQIPAVSWSLGTGCAAAFAAQIPIHLGQILGQSDLVTYRMFTLLESGTDPSEPVGGDDFRWDCGATVNEPMTVKPDADRDSLTAPLNLRLRTDLGIAIPLLTAYILDRIPTRPLKRLCSKREDLVDRLRQDCLKKTLKDFQPPR